MGLPSSLAQLHVTVQFILNSFRASAAHAHRVHRLWDRRKNPACGLMDNAAPGQLFAVGHGRALQALRVLSMALRMSSSLRITATSATLPGLPAARRRR